MNSESRNQIELLNYWNKVVMITGASSGIGRGLAVELARRGAKLGLVARRAEVIDEVVRRDRGGRWQGGRVAG